MSVYSIGNVKNILTCAAIVPILVSILMKGDTRMKLNAIKFGLACAATFSILWLVCSLSVIGMPMNMMQISGNMVHGDFASLQWSISAQGLVVGLIAWAFVAGISGWLTALIYNKLL